MGVQRWQKLEKQQIDAKLACVICHSREVARQWAYDPRLAQFAACHHIAIGPCRKQQRCGTHDRIVRSTAVTKFIVVFQLLNSWKKSKRPPQ